MKIATILLALTLISVPAHAKDALYRFSMWTAIVAHGIDATTTMHCLGRSEELVKQGKPPICVEQNTFLGRFNEPIPFGVAKMGIGAGQVLLVNKVKESGHTKLATAINFATTGIFGYIAVRNARVARR